MLDDIEHQDQIEESPLLLTDVGQFKLQPFVGLALAHSDGLRRDIVSPEAARIVHPLLQQLEHLAGATSDFADGLWVQTVFLEHSLNLSNLERGLVHVPKGILLKISPVGINISIEHLARDLCHLMSLDHGRNGFSVSQAVSYLVYIERGIGHASPFLAWSLHAPLAVFKHQIHLASLSPPFGHLLGQSSPDAVLRH